MKLSQSPGHLMEDFRPYLIHLCLFDVKHKDIQTYKVEEKKKIQLDF